MEHMNEVRAAIDEARREQKKSEIIESDRWKLETTLERAITPGPGEYNLDSGPKGPKGGTWGKHKPKSDVEWKIYRAAQIPGPGQYKLPSSVLVPGGTWGKHKPKSDVEWQMYRAAQIPGPGEYMPRALQSGVAVKFGNHNPPSDLDRAIRKARDLPVRLACATRAAAAAAAAAAEAAPAATPPPSLFNHVIVCSMGVFIVSRGTSGPRRVRTASDTVTAQVTEAVAAGRVSHREQGMMGARWGSTQRPCLELVVSGLQGRLHLGPPALLRRARSLNALGGCSAVVMS